MKPTEVFLLDDHKLVRDGLKSILSGHSTFHVSGEESDPENFMGKITELNFDLLVLDVSLPKVSGIDVIRKVKEQKPEAKIVMLSMHDNSEYARKSIREGASAYLPKDIEASEFVRALEHVVEKGTYSSHNKLQNESVIPAIDGITKALSQREIEVLIMMTEGKSSREIADKLEISPRTVETHRVNIMKKLGTSNSAETVAKALKLNLIAKS